MKTSSNVGKLSHMILQLDSQRQFFWARQRLIARKICRKSKFYGTLSFNKYVSSLSEHINELTEKMKKLQKHIRIIKAKHNQKFLGETVAEKLLNRSTGDPRTLRYATSSGRELKISFEMYKRGTKCFKPESFAEMLVQRLLGFKFDSHYFRDNSVKVVDFWDRTSLSHKEREAVILGNQPGVSSEEREKADDFSKKIKDTIRCHYRDTNRKQTLKIKDIFVLQLPPRTSSLSRGL